MSLLHSGSIHVVTNDAKFSLGVPSKSNSSCMIWYATSFGIAFSGNLNLHQNQTLPSSLHNTHTHDDDDVSGTHLGRGIRTYLEAKVEQRCSSESRVVVITISFLLFAKQIRGEFNSGNEFAWSLNSKDMIYF
jgi:hypothetical protein